MARFHQPVSDGHDRHTYRLRMMGALAVTLLLLNLIVQWWPTSEGGSFYPLYAAHEGPRITMDEVLQTVHVLEQKPPTIPLPPVIIPQDVLLSEIDLVLPDSFLVVEDTGEDREAASEETAPFVRAALVGDALGGRRIRCSCENH